MLLIRFHLETGARRGGALGLTRDGLDTERQAVRLVEKFDRVRWQPIGTALQSALLRHRSERAPGARHGDALFRYRNGRPLTVKRYESLFDRIGPVITSQTLSAHVLRHTAITWVEQVAGYSVAAEFAGHVQARPTDTYIHVTPAQVAAAVCAIWADVHPLVPLVAE